MERIAREYVRDDTPKAPSYRLPTAFTEACILWFAEGTKLSADELRELHTACISAQEVNRCLEEAIGVSLTPRAEYGGSSQWLTFAVTNHAKLKCENLLAQVPKARTVATKAIERMTVYNVSQA
jgi:hypothetical protein